MVVVVVVAAAESNTSIVVVVVVVVQMAVPVVWDRVVVAKNEEAGNYSEWEE